MSKLSDKQRRFVDEYIVDLNATRAAIRAGYSEKTAKQIGSQNLRKPYITEIIERYQNDIGIQIRAHFIFDAIRAREVMYEILNNPHAADRDRIAVAKDFLDRAGFKSVETVKLSGDVGVNPFKGLTTEQLIQLAGERDDEVNARTKELKQKLGFPDD